MSYKVKHFIGNVLIGIIPAVCAVAICAKVIHDDGWVCLLKGIGIIIGFGIVVFTLI